MTRPRATGTASPLAPDDEACLAGLALQSSDGVEAHEPVAVDTHERIAERHYERGQRQVDVVPARRRVDVAQPIGRLERPDLGGGYEDEALAMPRHDAGRHRHRRQRPLRDELLQALADALGCEGLQDGVGDAELVRLDGVIPRRGRQDESKLRGAGGCQDRAEPGDPGIGGGLTRESNVDECPRRP